MTTHKIPTEIIEYCFNEVKNNYDNATERMIERVIARTARQCAEKPPKDYSHRAKNAAKWGKVYCAEFKSRFRRLWKEYCEPEQAERRASEARKREACERAAFEEAIQHDSKRRKHSDDDYVIKEVDEPLSDQRTGDAFEEAEMQAYRDWLTGQLQRERSEPLDV